MCGPAKNAYRHDPWRWPLGLPRQDILEEAAIFDRAMTGGSRGVVEAIVSAYNFSASGHVVDIGGGQGAMIAAVLAAKLNVMPIRLWQKCKFYLRFIEATNSPARWLPVGANPGAEL